MSGVPARGELAEVLGELRRRAPLVHCLTATVSMGIVADGLLAAGGRPMMTETKGEAPTLVGVADALLVNLGTLSEDGVEGIPATVAAAGAAGTPWVLDPAAVGIAPVRTPLARRLLRDGRAGGGPTVLRGNASEVRVLAAGPSDQPSGGRGPDAVDRVDVAMTKGLARTTGAVVAVSGPVDVVTDGERLARVGSGSPLLTRVTGAGCLLGALTAACLPGADPFVAAVAATALLTVAGEAAAETARGPGSFRVALLDALAGPSPVEIAERVQLS